jgi:hypothetical protein
MLDVWIVEFLGNYGKLRDEGEILTFALGMLDAGFSLLVAGCFMPVAKY